jgi:hypothetical protein
VVLNVRWSQYGDASGKRRCREPYRHYSVMGIMRIQVCISKALRSRMITADRLIRKCVFPYQFLLQKIRLSLQSSLIAGKLPIDKLGQRIGSDNAHYQK